MLVLVRALVWVIVLVLRGACTRYPVSMNLSLRYFGQNSWSGLLPGILGEDFWSGFLVRLSWCWCWCWRWCWCSLMLALAGFGAVVVVGGGASAGAGAGFLVSIYLGRHFGQDSQGQNSCSGFLVRIPGASGFLGAGAGAGEHLCWPWCWCWHWFG